MSLTSGASLAWQFESSNIDYIRGFSPSYSTVAGTLTNLPTYVSGKYKQAIRLTQTAPNTGANTYVLWSLSSIPISIDTTGITVACWVNWTTFQGSCVSMYDAFTNVLGITMTSTVTQTSQGFAGTQSLKNATSNTSTNSVGVWYHIALTYNSTSVILYKNGVGTTPVSTGAPSVTITGIRIGSQANNIQGPYVGYACADCAIDDLRVYNTALTAAQVQAVYQAQGAPGRAVQVNTIGANKTTLSGTPLFAQLSAAAVSSAVGAFSLRAVNGTTAKAVRVKRASDNVQQDFWADRLGNLLTAPVTGIPLQNWLGGSGANVVTWYDQSSLGNNATGSGSIIYQTSNVNMKWAVQSGSVLTVTSPSTFITNTNFTIHSITRRTTSSQAPGGGGTAPTNQSIYSYTPGTGWPGTVAYNRILTLYDYQGNRMGFNSVNTSIAQYAVIGNTGCGLYSTSGPVDYLSVIWNGTTTQMYYNGSTSASTAAGTFGNIPNTNNFYLMGCPAYGAVVGGEFGEIIVFKTALGTADIATLYSSR